MFAALRVVARFLVVDVGFLGLRAGILDAAVAFSAGLEEGDFVVVGFLRLAAGSWGGGMGVVVVCARMADWGC